MIERALRRRHTAVLALGRPRRQVGLPICSVERDDLAVLHRRVVPDRRSVRFPPERATEPAALYLCHVPVIVLIYNKSPAYANDALLYGVGVAAALAASSIVGRVDLLLYGALKHRADQSGPAFRYALSSAFAIITLAYGGYAELAAATRQEAKMIPSPPNATVVAVRVLNEDERQRK